MTLKDVEILLNDSNLLPFEKVTLQDGLIEGTHTQEYILGDSRKAKT